jgi:hypothetical protein
LLIALSPGGVRKVTEKEVLNEGWSKPGKAARASIDSNCVQLYQSSPTLTRNMPLGPVWNGAS